MRPRPSLPNLPAVKAGLAGHLLLPSRGRTTERRAALPRGQRNVLSLARTLAGLSPEDARLATSFAKELRDMRAGKSAGGGKKKAAPKKKGTRKKKAAEVEEDEGGEE